MIQFCLPVMVGGLCFMVGCLCIFMGVAVLLTIPKLVQLIRS